MNPVRLPPGPRGDGDAWVKCRCGHRHWGRYGAAGLLLAHDRSVLLQLRAAWSHEGGTWSIPGGARSSTEATLAAALREAHEEARVPFQAVQPQAAYADDHGSWSYTTIVAESVRPFTPAAGDSESLRLEWVRVSEVGERALHPAFAAAWPSLRTVLGTRVVLVVDSANVVGSVPDGWWRDRAGATARLRDSLARLAAQGVPTQLLSGGHVCGEGGPPTFPMGVVTWWPRIVLVAEGQARGVEPVAGVEVVAAAASGDDALVDLVSEAAGEPQTYVFVVTADRALRARVDQAGGWPLSPRALLDALA